MECTHLDHIQPGVMARTDGCEECLREGTEWVQLRTCLECGHVGCCDSSEGKHASRHFHETRHPLMRSYQAPKDFVWCYEDETYLDPSVVQAASEQPSV